MLVTLEEAKKYLRVDVDAENDTIQTNLNAAQALCLDVARMDETAAQGEEYLPTLRESILYVTAFMFEHRSDADYAGMMLTLRSILSQIRGAAF